jgi:hypothetical protein
MIRTPLLIATDVAARGLDIPQVEVRQKERENATLRPIPPYTALTYIIYVPFAFRPPLPLSFQFLLRHDCCVLFYPSLPPSLPAFYHTLRHLFLPFSVPPLFISHFFLVPTPFAPFLRLLPYPSIHLTLPPSFTSPPFPTPNPYHSLSVLSLFAVRDQLLLPFNRGGLCTPYWPYG